VTEQLQGRKEAVTLVRGVMDRPLGQRGRPTTKRCPVLVFEAPAGGGKTALLDATAGLLHQRVPYAYLDLTQTNSGNGATFGVPQLLSALAFELAHRCRRYGRLRFPRLVVGLLAMGLDLDVNERAAARRQVTDALKKHRRLDEASLLLQKTAGRALQLVVRQQIPDDLVETAATLLVNGAVRWVPGLTLGRYLNWYGHQDRKLPDDPIDTLVDVNRWARSPAGSAARYRLDVLLAAAFLADLRHDFADSRRADERSLNCVVLLDDADAEPGPRLLEVLVQARRDDLDHGCDPPDPLTVVAASRGALLTGVDRADQATFSTGFPINRGVRPVMSPVRSGNRAQAQWLRYPLPSLTVNEVYPMATALVPDGDRRLATMVHQLTAGHPAATRIVLDAIAAAPGPWHSLAEILQAGRNGSTVEERLLRLLLDDASDDVVEDLVTCSPARTRHGAVEFAVRHGHLLAASRLTEAELRVSPMWGIGNGTQPSMLRRLLLRRLAARTDGAATWSAVHSRLRERSRHRRQTTRNPEEAAQARIDELSYALAEGDVEFVVRELARGLESVPESTWFELLEAVTSVPGLMDPYTDSIVQARSLTEWVDPHDAELACVAGLVARLWIAADPYRGSDRRTLHRQLARDYDDLARQRPAWDGELQARKDVHVGQARLWGADGPPREMP
jgi:hypothetical protein